MPALSCADEGEGRIRREVCAAQLPVWAARARTKWPGGAECATPAVGAKRGEPACAWHHTRRTGPTLAERARAFTTTGCSSAVSISGRRTASSGTRCVCGLARQLFGAVGVRRQRGLGL